MFTMNRSKQWGPLRICIGASAIIMLSSDTKVGDALPICEC